MDRYGYILNKTPVQKPQQKHYTLKSLQDKTTYQLREICREEKIISGVVNSLDQEELIREILRFRGAYVSKLIQDAKESTIATLEQALASAKKHFMNSILGESGPSVVTYKNRMLNFQDEVTIPYHSNFANTNAFIVDAQEHICAIVNLKQNKTSSERLYMIKDAESFCKAKPGKNYRLYCFGQKDSEALYEIACGTNTVIPEHLDVCVLPLLNFTVKSPAQLSMPLAIDFGSSNTTAAVYLDASWLKQSGLKEHVPYLKENEINYVMFSKTSSILPSVVCVCLRESGELAYTFGDAALRQAQKQQTGFEWNVFYDIKRWINQLEKEEEIINKQGMHVFVARKEILKKFFLYVIQQAENHFKCHVTCLHISSPVKQKELFERFFQKILPEYFLNDSKLQDTEENTGAVHEKLETLDEGTAVLYDVISGMIASETVENGKKYHALIIDCGGGTTDLSSCRFQVQNHRVAYDVSMETTYENGNTNFGGNNLTYRIFQLLKISIGTALFPHDICSISKLLKTFDADIYRLVDMYGTKKLYEELEEEYEKAEDVLPTRFELYQKKSKEEYFKVKHNFYFLFGLAEAIKTNLFGQRSNQEIFIGSHMASNISNSVLSVEKWQLNILKNDAFENIKDFPNIKFDKYNVSQFLKPEVYGVIGQLLNDFYEEDTLGQYDMIKLTGQSCKMELFRDALREFVPGKVIQFNNSPEKSQDVALKMTCVNGAATYLKENHYGLVKLHIHHEIAALPYAIMAYTHTGKECVLVQAMNPKPDTQAASISRNMENILLKLYLLNSEHAIQYEYTVPCDLQLFKPVTQEELTQNYGKRILQDATDSIENGEVKFFVWQEYHSLGFTVLPILRKNQMLMVGEEQFLAFETDGWLTNFFDGMK